LPEYSGGFRRKRTRWKTWPATISRQISNFRFEELARDTDQTRASLTSGHAIVTRRRKDQGTQPRLFRIGFRARRAVLFLRNEREAFLEQTRSLRCAGDVANAWRRIRGLTASRRTDAHRRRLELQTLLLFESNERNHHWYERRNKGVFLTATPIDVSQYCGTLFEKFDS